MKLKQAKKLSFLIIMCLFLGLSCVKYSALSPIKIDTSFVDKGVVELSEDRCTWWRVEHLILPENKMNALKSLNGKNIPVSCSLYQIISDLCTQVVSLSIERDSLVQLYQDHEISEQYLKESFERNGFLDEQLGTKILDNLIKLKVQCV